jgi:hypothetical protein
MDNGLHAPGTQLTCLYSTNAAQIGSTVDVELRNSQLKLLDAVSGIPTETRRHT